MRENIFLEEIIQELGTIEKSMKADDDQIKAWCEE